MATWHLPPGGGVERGVGEGRGQRRGGGWWGARGVRRVTSGVIRRSQPLRRLPTELPSRLCRGALVAPAWPLGGRGGRGIMLVVAAPIGGAWLVLGDAPRLLRGRIYPDGLPPRPPQAWAARKHIADGAASPPTSRFAALEGWLFAAPLWRLVTLWWIPHLPLSLPQHLQPTHYHVQREAGWAVILRGTNWASGPTVRGWGS